MSLKKHMYTGFCALNSNLTVTWAKLRGLSDVRLLSRFVYESDPVGLAQLVLTRPLSSSVWPEGDTR